MAITITYQLQKIKNLDLTGGPQTTAEDVVSLASGGFAAAGNHLGLTDVDFFNSLGTDVGGSVNNSGTGAALAQLSNGNLVVVGSDGDGSPLYKIVTTGGSVVLGTTDTNDTGQGSEDVAALAGGGFVMVSGDFDNSILFGPSVEIDVRIYSSAGVLQTEFKAVDFDSLPGIGLLGSAGAPRVAPLNDGGFAVVWEQIDETLVPPSSTPLGKFAIYNANGSQRLAPSNLGGTNPASISVAGQADGGFAVAYVDERWDTDTEITLEQYNLLGTLVRTTRITSDGQNNFTPEITRLSNGFLALAYNKDFGSDKDTVVALIDPTTGTVLDDIAVTADELFLDDVTSPTLAGFGDGQIAVFQTNVTDNDADGEHLQVVRVTTGDDMANALFGDVLADSIVGAQGNDTLTGNGGNDTLLGGIGNDSMNGGSGTDTASYAFASSAVTASLAAGTASNDGQGGSDTLTAVENLLGSIFADTLTGNVGDNTLDGNSGADTLSGGLGQDVLNGGAGRDTATYGGAFRQSSLVGNPSANSNAVLIGPEGADTLNGIETLLFVDGLKSYDAASPIWQIQRLYGSAFDRTADTLGLNFHAGRLDSGTAIAVVAQDFAGSAEFLATYGSLSNSGFVSQLYLNVLDRPADSGGLAYWTGQLDSGALTRGGVLAGFSESAENITNYAPQLALGLWDIDESAASVARLYRATFDRAPDANGLVYWTGQLKTGAQTLTQEAGVFITSPEFVATYGSLNNSQFITQLYQNVLDRAPDAGGLSYWTGQLDSGAQTRAQVLVGFSESQEHVVNTIGVIDNGIVLL